MPIDQNTDTALHRKLPIDGDEKILAVYRHHWFAYASIWFTAFIIVAAILSLAGLLTTVGGSTNSLADHRLAVIGGAAVFCAFVLLGACIPAYLRSQEQLVLTEEALLQVLQPSLFSSKVDQLNLHRIDDISVRQDFFGTMFGYGHMTIETPGEQDNYEFFMLPQCHEAARTLSQAKENYEAALGAGRLHTTLGEPQQPAVPAIDPQQYQQFLEYQQMVARQQQEQAAAAPAPVQPADVPTQLADEQLPPPANNQQ